MHGELKKDLHHINSRMDKLHKFNPNLWLKENHQSKTQLVEQLLELKKTEDLVQTKIEGMTNLGYQELIINKERTDQEVSKRIHSSIVFIQMVLGLIQN